MPAASPAGLLILSPSPIVVFGVSVTLVGLSPPKLSPGFEAAGALKDKGGALDVDTAGVDVLKLNDGWAGVEIAGFLLVSKPVSPAEDETDVEAALGVWKLKPAVELEEVVENKPVEGVVLGFIDEAPNKPVELVAAGASDVPNSPPPAFFVVDPNKPPVDWAATVGLAAGAPNKLFWVDDDEVVCVWNKPLFGGFVVAPNKPPVLWLAGVDDDPNKPPLFVFFEAPKSPTFCAVVLAGVPKLKTLTVDNL